MRRRILAINCPFDAATGKISCVYKLSIGQQFYIGQTKDLRKRVLTHLITIPNGYIINISVPGLFRVKAIHFTILEIVDNKNMLKERELYYLRLHRNNKYLINKKTKRFELSLK